MNTLASKPPRFAAILLLGLLAMTARSATDPDLWWHLRTGQWVVETGHVPHSDPFSFTRAEHGPQTPKGDRGEQQALSARTIMNVVPGNYGIGNF